MGAVLEDVRVDRGTGWRVFGCALAQLGHIVPRSWHLALSRATAAIFEWRASALLISPYCRWQYGDKDHWKKFEPGSSGLKYRSFQDFFTRNFVASPAPRGDSVWPCEGLFCQMLPYESRDANWVDVKGEWMRPRTIFAIPERRHDSDLFVYNVFLHNRNYHHIHSPVSGTVTRVVRIPGKLYYLRPWAYRDPSFPALRNERVVIDIEDGRGWTWSLAIVGGPLVGSVRLSSITHVGSRVMLCEKIASFLMGSTVCLLAPVRSMTSVGTAVEVGDRLG